MAHNACLSSAPEGGGIFLGSGFAFTAVNSAVVGNFATNGGGIYSEATSFVARLVHTIVAGNGALTDNDLHGSFHFS